MIRQPRLCFVLPLALTLICGCGREPFPKEKLDKVTTFSLGSAQKPKLPEDPTGQEVYDAALKLYDSFHSVAASSTSFSVEICGWKERDGEITNIKSTRTNYATELRVLEPDKSLVKHSGDSDTVQFTNSGRSFWYMPDRNTYVDFGRPAARRHSLAAQHLGFPIHPGMKITSIRRLPDAKLGGTEVYVIEMRVDPRKPAKNGLRAASDTRQFFLGKRDLLPRKMVSWVDCGRDKRVPKDTSTETYSGIVINTHIPPGVFPTEPPKQSKPEAGK